MVARLVLETSDVMSSRFESEDAHQINASPAWGTNKIWTGTWWWQGSYNPFGQPITDLLRVRSSPCLPI